MTAGAVGALAVAAALTVTAAQDQPGPASHDPGADIPVTSPGPVTPPDPATPPVAAPQPVVLVTASTGAAAHTDTGRPAPSTSVEPPPSNQQDIRNTDNGPGNNGRGKANASNGNHGSDNGKGTNGKGKKDG